MEQASVLRDQNGHPWRFRVEPGSYLPGPPTDPCEQDSRTRFLKSQVRCVKGMDPESGQHPITHPLLRYPLLFR